MDHEQMAVTVLRVLWRDIDDDFKSQYRRDIWRMFQDAIYTSANQNGTLKSFIHALTMRMNGGWGRNEADRQSLIEVIRAEQDDALLDLFRDETGWLVILVKEHMKQVRETADDTYGI